MSGMNTAGCEALKWLRCPLAAPKLSARAPGVIETGETAERERQQMRNLFANTLDPFGFAEAAESGARPRMASCPLVRLTIGVVKQLQSERQWTLKLSLPACLGRRRPSEQLEVRGSSTWEGRPAVQEGRTQPATQEGRGFSGSAATTHRTLHLHLSGGSEISDDDRDDRHDDDRMHGF